MWSDLNKTLDKNPITQEIYCPNTSKNDKFVHFGDRQVSLDQKLIDAWGQEKGKMVRVGN